MSAIVKVVLKDGSEITLGQWQKLYGLPVGSDKIGMHYSLKEPIFQRDIKDYGVLVVNSILIEVMDQLREETGESQKVNAFNRSKAKQLALRKSGMRAAVTSPHEYFMAADLDTVSKVQTKERVKQLQAVAKRLGYKIRIGFEQYLSDGFTFIHVDVCPEFYGKGKPFHNQPHPPVWEQAITW